ncbi:Rtc5 protein [Saccharomycopsis crataegensis]|uniref:Rtc5 protein n=1 Tax=Saccharomycopsis crataegensis TaxID=43959 RepID=A0AAV5QNQ8_9ASCO|nr:Rtc5 protein [Saccharomycopsis crataegensis]
MGQAASSSEPSSSLLESRHSKQQPVGYVSQATIQRLFLKSCLHQFDSYELYCLKKNLLGTDHSTESSVVSDTGDSSSSSSNISGESMRKLIHIDTLNKYFKIPKTTPIYNIFYKFLKQLSIFPIISPPSRSQPPSSDTPSNFEYFELGEIIKIIVLLTPKRSHILGPHYDIGKLVFITLSIVGLKDGIQQCQVVNGMAADDDDEDDNDDSETIEQQSTEKSRKPLEPTNSTQTIKEFNEKTGEVMIKYPVYEQKITWSRLPLIEKFDDVDFKTHKIPATYCLNFLTLLLVAEISVIAGLYDPQLAKLTTNAKGTTTIINSSGKKPSKMDFGDTISKIEAYRNHNMNQKYNSIKVHAFQLIKSIDCTVKDGQKLLQRTSTFNYRQFQRFVDKTAPFILPNLQNLCLSFTYFVHDVGRMPKPEDQFQQTKLMTLANLSQLATFLSLTDSTPLTNDGGGEEKEKEKHHGEETTASGTTNSGNFNITPFYNFNINNCRNLYLGSKYGFSMKSFEYKVFNWNAPSIMLISGKKILNPLKYGDTKNSKFHKFNQTYPKLLQQQQQRPPPPPPPPPPSEAASPSDKVLGETMVYGVYISKPWRKTNKRYFGDDRTMIFQLSPHQNLFRAKTAFSASDPATSQLGYFNTEGGGIGFGNSQPLMKNGKLLKYSAGNVSLTIDSNLEFGVFRHLGTAAGGVYDHGSIYDDTTTTTNNNNNNDDDNDASSGDPMIPTYEDKFLINEIEVWGIGSDEVFKQQLATWAWEEREADRRNRVNLKNLGEERAFLEMAGIISGNTNSGGSM